MTMEGGEAEELLVSAEEEGSTLLELLSERLYDVSTSGLRRIIKGGGVAVDGRPASEDRVLRAGERIALELPEEDELLRFRAARLEGFSVLYEDARCLACAKPAGVAVIAERGETKAPFLSAVLDHLETEARKAGLARPPRPRVVHRIDKETSGVVLLAKDKDALRSLSEQFSEREVVKDYLGLVLGEIPDEQASGEIDLPIGELEKSHARRMRTGGRDAKPARTGWEVQERFRGHTLVRLRPLTGRQHQIRVHLEAIGYPLAVDPLYGGEEALLLSKIKPGYRQKEDRQETPLLARLSLHAEKIAFRSPALERESRTLRALSSRHAFSQEGRGLSGIRALSRLSREKNLKRR
ncbi:RluA family pseudouridine synthase [bacterium]|nr:RluA family pseudouridine synthase [bacterium]